MRQIDGVPIDRTAHRVVQRGTHYEFKPLGEAFSDLPLPTRPWPHGVPRTTDLAGKKFGRLTVIGMAPKGGKSSAWVVKCECGAYTHRTAKALVGGYDSRCTQCTRCDNIEKMRQGTNSLGLSTKSLKRAQMPMYHALKEILKFGLTPATRHAAIEATTLAERRPTIAGVDEGAA